MLMKRPEKEQHRMQSSINWADVAKAACEKIDYALSDIPAVFEEGYDQPSPKFNYKTKSGAVMDALFGVNSALTIEDVALDTNAFIERDITPSVAVIANQIRSHPGNKPGAVFNTVGLEIPGNCVAGYRMDNPRLSVRVLVIPTDEQPFAYGMWVDVLGGFASPESAEVAACQ